MTARPWGREEPIAWALRTGRLHPVSEARWRASYAGDPAAVEDLLPSLAPVLAVDTPDGRALRRTLGIDAPPDADAQLYDELFSPPAAPMMTAKDKALYEALYGRPA